MQPMVACMLSLFKTGPLNMHRQCKRAGILYMLGFPEGWLFNRLP